MASRPMYPLDVTIRSTNMSKRTKGFDPLSSLFDPPKLPPRNTEGALPPIDDDPVSEQPVIRDRSFQVINQAEPVTRPSTMEPEAGVEPLSTNLPEMPPLPKSNASKQAVAPSPPPPAPQQSPEDKVALAKALARAAMAKAQAAQAKAPPKAAPAPPPPAGQSPQDKAALAKALAKAAMAKAKAAQAKAPAPKTGAVSPKRSPLASAPPPKAAPPSLANRARRPTSALEAARAASAQEDERRAAADAAAEAVAEAELPRMVAALLSKTLPGLSDVTVANALPMDDRNVLTALWKAHRARFGAVGDLSRMVAATTVIRALKDVSEGRLVAAIVDTGSGDYLVWVDLESSTIVGAFPDARAWYAGA